MMDLTEQQEQEMIDRAKAGDPEANYQMSLWALDQAMAEPDEERWNRLAAKCLVKAAEAGYAPAKEKMDELLLQTEPQAAAQPAATAAAAAEPTEPAAAAAPVQAAPTAEAPAQTAERAAGEPFSAKAARAGKAVLAAFAALGGKVKGLFSKSESAGSASADGEGKKASFLNFSQWDDAKWKKMQTVCIIICVILAILIAIMLISGRKNRTAEPEAELEIPAAEVIATPVPTATPAPVLYPAEAVRVEIDAANLEVYPEDEDYVTEPTTATVSTSGNVLNIRRGPAQSYGQVTSADNGETLDVYAYKNNWALVQYNGSWGWCSGDFLK